MFHLRTQKYYICGLKKRGIFLDKMIGVQDVGKIIKAKPYVCKR